MVREKTDDVAVGPDQTCQNAAVLGAPRVDCDAGDESGFLLTTAIVEVHAHMYFWRSHAVI